MSLDLRKELEALTGAYYEEAPGGCGISLQGLLDERLSDAEGQQQYVLEVNAWDQHRYYSRAEGMMDSLEKRLHRCNFMADGFLIRIFRGQRQDVPDPDRTIKRVREQFEMHVYERRIEMAKKRSYSGYTKKTMENLLLDAGAFFKNFTYEEGGESNDTFDSAVKAGKLIGATKGGGEFSAVAAIRQIEVDGVKGRAKGLEVIDSWDVYIKATVLETTAESIKAALGAAAVDTESDERYDIITGNAAIEMEDYLDNVTWVGTLSGSNEPVIIQVYNGLNTEGLKLTVQDKGEATIPMTFYGHYTDDDLDSPPFKVLYPKKQGGKPVESGDAGTEQA